MEWTERQNYIGKKPLPAYTTKLHAPYEEAAIYQYEQDGALFLTCKALNLERVPLNTKVPNVACRNAEEILTLAFLTYKSGAKRALALLRR